MSASERVPAASAGYRDCYVSLQDCDVICDLSPINRMFITVHVLTSALGTTNLCYNKCTNGQRIC